MDTRSASDVHLKIYLKKKLSYAVKFVIQLKKLSMSLLVIKFEELEKKPPSKFLCLDAKLIKMIP